MNRTPSRLPRTRRPPARGRSALVLLAAIAVPALAAPDEWRGFEIGDATSVALVLQPMPFEKPGDSFPGSAFYYLAADEALAVPGVHGDGDMDPLGGPIARALRQAGSPLDRTRALQCLTAAVYYEAASEADAGQRAVAQVVLNRVAHPSYPNTVCGVVYQGSERTTGCQFSFTCDGSLARAPARMFWLRAENVARAALAGFVYAPVGLATHYHTIQIHPYWADSLAQIGTIGAHRFYRFGGPAGAPAAFSAAYFGGEPIAAPHARSAAPAAAVDAALDPLVLQRAYEEGLKKAQVQPVWQTGDASSPAPAYAPELEERGGDAIYRGEKLPESTGVRPEYENSGRWIKQPGS